VALGVAIWHRLNSWGDPLEQPESDYHGPSETPERVHEPGASPATLHSPTGSRLNAMPPAQSQPTVRSLWNAFVKIPLSIATGAGGICWA